MQAEVNIRNKAAVDLCPSVSLSHVSAFFFNTKASLPRAKKTRNILGGVNERV